MKTFTLFAAAALISPTCPSFAQTPADPPVTITPIIAPDDPIAAAASGLVAQIEDDNNPGGDLQLVSMKSDGCVTTIMANGRNWTVDWAIPGRVEPADTFIFIDVPPVKIAIVGDASKPDQAEKLSALFYAMFETQLDCGTQF